MIFRKVFILVLLLISCYGCSDGADSNSGEPSADSSSGEALISENCTNLNPDKVYMVGVLDDAENHVGKNHVGLADPYNPWDYCLGFEDMSIVSTANISSTGHLIFADRTSEVFYTFMPERLTKNLNDEWVFPENVYANDKFLFSLSLAGCGIGRVYLQKGTDDIFFTCPHRIINSETVHNYYDIGSSSDNKLLAVLPDMSLLVFTFEELKLVDKSMNETILDMPESISNPVCSSAKQFFDTVDATSKVWIECYDSAHYSSQDESQHRRFTLNIQNKTLVDDGIYAPMPQGLGLPAGGKFDGDGNLWLSARLQSDLDVGVIVKRPLLGGQTEVVYSNEQYNGSGDWKTDQIPFLKLTNVSNPFVTGP